MSVSHDSSTYDYSESSIITAPRKGIIKEAFKTFCQAYPYLSFESAIEYFAILGGDRLSAELDYFESVDAMVASNFVHHFSTFQQKVSPSYLLESPYRDVLIAVARGDGKYYSVLRKAKLSEQTGERIVTELVQMGILYIEASREQPLKTHPKHKVKKAFRSYRIQDKLRFHAPFMRFWFGFVTPFSHLLSSGDGERFMEHFRNHYERLRTLVFEQLCNDFLVDYFAQKGIPLLSHGSYWNHHSEFDILAVTSDKKVILGECKYKDRKVCKNELNKLKAKAKQSAIRADIYVLFSKDGFSNELLGMQDKNLLLFDLKDLQNLCV